MKRILNIILLFSLLLSACMPIQQPTDATATTSIATPAPPATTDAADLNAPLPPDPDLRIGKLENGLTYYILKNDEPKKRAELRLAVNAGSVMEEDDQKGLAHFLEHMLFNGTKRFPHNELISFLESLGMDFGADINAYTSFDETVYQLQVPTDKPEVVTQAFDVLEDWASAATIDPQEVEKERGVIVEEWRLRDANAQGRVQDKQWPVLLGDSQYTVRQPIGDMEIIRNAPAETLRRFYETWYRPDLMAIVAVGDFDVDTIEKEIKDHFAHLTSPQNEQARPTFDIPPHDEPRYQVVSDPEYPSAEIQVLIKRPATLTKRVGDIRNGLRDQLFYEMLNQRFAELARSAKPPFVQAYATKGNYVRPIDVTLYDAQVQEDGIETGLRALLTEIERVHLHGFTASELERAQKNILRRYEQNYNERDNMESQWLVDGFVYGFLTGNDNGFTSVELDYELAQQLVPGITLDEVNGQVAELTASQNRVALVVGPEKQGLTLPSEARIAAIYQEIQSSAIEPYVDQTSDAALVATIPEAVAIVEESEHTELGITEFTLQNGVRVLMKPTDFKQDEVLFSASSPGGSSRSEDKDYWATFLAPFIVSQSGVGDFTQSELTKQLAGKVVSVSPYISRLEEGFSGSASPADLETLFQLIYLYTTAPRADDEGYSTIQNQYTAFLKNFDLDPQNALRDTFEAAMYGDNIRRRVPEVEDITAVSKERAFEIYQERFANLGDATFVFVGNFDPAQLKDLAQHYLGNLPNQTDGETWIDREPPLPNETIEDTVYKGEEEKSYVKIVFSGEADPSEEKQAQIAALRRLLDIRVTEALREEMGGIYGARVSSQMTVIPKGMYLFTFEFNCDPKRVDELVAALFDLIKSVQEEGTDDDHLNRVHQQTKSDLEEAVQQNDWWLTKIDYFATTPDRQLDDLNTALQPDASIDNASIQAAAQQYLPLDRYVKVVLYPESYKK